MVKINSNYQNLEAGYLFPEIARRVNTFIQEKPNAKLIRMGIGDVVLPIPSTIQKAMHNAIDDLGTIEKFHGYGPEAGYGFLRDAITNYYKQQSVKISSDEIFVSDGSKCDSGNIQEIFDAESIIAITDPVYPVYVDTNVMAGRGGFFNDLGRYQNLVYMSCNQSTQFQPQIPNEHVDLIYLCSPNNPTGTVMPKKNLQEWVNYAKKKKAVILYDGAYEAFIQDKDAVHSIYEIEGSKEVAIEFRSFSKYAGFTGLRCAYTVIPKELKIQDSKGTMVSVSQFWNRRQSTKFNGASYPIQKGATAALSEQGQIQCQELIIYYMENAKRIKEALQNNGYTIFGGTNAPYLWIQCPKDKTSWEMFDYMLQEHEIVVTPGSGFGSCGEGFFRISSFALKENVKEAINRITSKPLS